MESSRLEQLYKDFVMSPELRALEKLKASPNIFDVFNISHYEIRHSNFLNWLLNPQGNHGFGHRVLLDFLREVALDERAKGMSIIDLANMSLEGAHLRREWHSIDLLIELPGLIVVIENKIGASESNNQLQRYRQVIENNYPNHKKVFVFLTPSGTEASENQTWVNLSYNAIIRILEDLLKIEEHSLSLKVQFYLKDYISTLKNDIMSNGDIAELARKIYKGHKELFDTIIEHKPDAAAEFKDILQLKAIKRGYEMGSPNKGYLRVLTKQLYELIPRGVHRNWPLGEAFTFEVDFLWAKGYARIYCNIPPGDEAFRSYLNKIFEGLEDYKKPSGGIWLTYFHRRLDFNIKKVMEDDPEKAEQKADLILDELDKLVAKVEPAILAHADELKGIIEKRNQILS
jgi:hypothetical protein